jgi:hypothetical protein
LTSVRRIDEGSVATPGFETWLEQYRGLMTCLESFRLVFVATRDTNFMWERLFQHFIRSLPRPFDTAPGPSVARLIEYFRLEKGCSSGAAQTESGRLKELREEFQSPLTQRFFHLWQQAGDEAVVGFLDHVKPSAASGNATFSTCRLPWRYEIFQQNP